MCKAVVCCSCTFKDLREWGARVAASAIARSDERMTASDWVDACVLKVIDRIVLNFGGTESGRSDNFGSSNCSGPHAPEWSLPRSEPFLSGQSSSLRKYSFQPAAEWLRSIYKNRRFGSEWGFPYRPGQIAPSARESTCRWWDAITVILFARSRTSPTVGRRSAFVVEERSFAGSDRRWNTRSL